MVEALGVELDPSGYRLGEPGAQPDDPHDEYQGVGVDPRERSAAPRPRGSFPWRVATDPLLLIALRALLAGLLGLRRSALDEPDRDEDEQGELEVLGLPVLHHGLAEGGRSQVVAEPDRGRVVLDLVLVEGVEPRDRLAHQRGQEQEQEAQGEPIVRGESPDPRAHWWRNPISEK